MNEINNKLLFKFEFDMTAKEYGKMAEHLPSAYWSIVATRSVILVLIACVWAILSRLPFATIFIIALMCEVLLMIYYREYFCDLATKGFIKGQKKNPVPTHFIYEFYERHLVQRLGKAEAQVAYFQFEKVVETPTHFYMWIKKHVVILPKDQCDPELIKFVHDMYKKGKTYCFKANRSLTNSNRKRMQIILWIWFALTILAMPLAFLTKNAVADQIFGLEIIHYKWTYWLWIFVPYISIILGIIWSKRKVGYKKNIITGLVVVILMVLVGQLSTITNGTYKKMHDYEEIMHVQLPTFATIQVDYFEEYLYTKKNLIRAQIFCMPFEVSALEESIKASPKWMQIGEFDENLHGYVPVTTLDINQVYVLIYNQTLDKYNYDADEEVEYKMYVILFDPFESKIEFFEYECMVQEPLQKDDEADVE